MIWYSVLYDMTAYIKYINSKVYDKKYWMILQNFELYLTLKFQIWKFLQYFCMVSWAASCLGQRRLIVSWLHLKRKEEKIIAGKKNVNCEHPQSHAVHSAPIHHHTHVVTVHDERDVWNTMLRLLVSQPNNSDRLKKRMDWSLGGHESWPVELSPKRTRDTGWIGRGVDNI